MSARPTSITVIGWLLIVFGVIGFLASGMMAALIDSPLMQQSLIRSPLPPALQITMGLLGSTVSLLCGIGCLKRWGWVRYVYVAWMAASILLNVFTSPYSVLLMIPSVVFFAVVIYFLFASPARTYFAGRDGAAPAA